MPLIYDIKNKKNVRVDNDMADDLLRRQGSGFMPIPSWKYTVEDPESGEVNEVWGNEVRQKIKSGFILHDTVRSRVRNYVRSQNTQLGAFAKGLLDEGLTLGLYGALKKNPANEVERIYDELYEQEYGTARSIGKGFGLLGPLLGGGIIGAIGKGAVAKTTSKLLKKTIPSSIALNQINKLGMATARGAKKAASKIGIKNKRALQLIGGAGLATGWSVGDTALFTPQRAIRAGRQSSPEVNGFDIRVALEEAKRAGPEIFTTSMLFGGGSLGAISILKGGISLGAKVAKPVVQFAGKQIRDADLAHYLRKEFFNTPESQEAFFNLKRKIGYSHRYLSQYLTTSERRALYNKIPQSIRDANKRLNPNNLKEIIENSSEKDIINLLTKIITRGPNIPSKKLSIFPNKTWKMPRNRKEVFEESRKRVAYIGEKLSGIRDTFYKDFKFHQKRIDKMKQKFWDVPEIWKNLINSTVLKGTTLEKLNKIYNKPKKFWTKKPLDKWVSKLIPRRHKPSINEQMEEFYEKIFQLSKKQKNVNIDINNPEQAFENFMVWLTNRTAQSTNIKSLKVGLSTAYEKELYRVWENAGLPRQLLPVIREQLKGMYKRDPGKFSGAFDMFKVNLLLHTSKLNPEGVETIFKVFKDYFGKIEATSSKMRLAKYIYDLSEVFETLMPKYLFYDSKKLISRLDTFNKNINEIERKLVSQKAVSTVKQIQALIKDKRRVSVLDINRLMTAVGELANFSSTKLPKKAQEQLRKLYKFLSDIEDGMFEQIQKHDKRFNVNELRSLKGQYSLLNTIGEIFDRLTKPASKGGNITFRDLMFTAGGIGGGGALAFSGMPLAGLAVAGAAYGASRYAGHALSKGKYFLQMANHIDNFNAWVKKQHNTFMKFKDKKKLNRFLKSPGALKGININTATISLLLMDEAHQDFESFYQALNQKSSSDILTTGQELESSIIQNIGSYQDAMDMRKNLMNIKRYIMSIMPQGRLDKYGNKTFTSFEKNVFFKKLQNTLSPETFLNSVKFGTLYRGQKEAFAQLFPDHYNSLILSIVEGMRDKSLDMSLQTKVSVDLLFNNDTLNILPHIDSLERDKKAEKLEKVRRGGIKMSQFNQPMQSQRIAGGKI